MGKLGFIGLLVVTSLLTGCHYYQEYRQMKGTADALEERAEIMKAQRECAQKYELDPAEIDRRCGVYQDMLQNLGATRSSGR